MPLLVYLSPCLPVCLSPCLPVPLSPVSKLAAIPFTAPVPSGSNVRLKARLLGAERRGESVRYRVGVEVEVENQDKPALVGEVVYLATS